MLLAIGCKRYIAYLYNKLVALRPTLIINEEYETIYCKYSQNLDV